MVVGGAAQAELARPVAVNGSAAPPGTEAPTYLQAIRLGLIEELRRDETVIVFGEDVGGKKGGVFRVTEGLAEMFGTERVFNSPLAEASIVGVGIGAAMA